jgi:hypothetical protein
LHQEVRALLPAVLQAQQVGPHWVGSVQTLPGAPSLQVTALVAPSQPSSRLALAIEPASVTATGDPPQRDTAPPLVQPARHAIRTTHPSPYESGIRPSASIRLQHRAGVKSSIAARANFSAAPVRTTGSAIELFREVVLRRADHTFGRSRHTVGDPFRLDLFVPGERARCFLDAALDVLPGAVSLIFVHRMKMSTTAELSTGAARARHVAVGRVNRPGGRVSCSACR